MVSRKSAEPSPESIARAERQRVAQEEGARAMADVAREAVSVRKTMERLRALRLAKEAEEAVQPAAETPDVKKKAVRKKAAK